MNDNHIYIKRNKSDKPSLFNRRKGLPFFDNPVTFLKSALSKPMNFNSYLGLGRRRK